MKAGRRYRRANPNLTPIQAEVLQHRANGLKLDEIRALYPHLSEHSVRGQLWICYQKLSAKNGEEAVAIGMRRGIIH